MFSSISRLILCLMACFAMLPMLSQAQQEAATVPTSPIPPNFGEYIIVSGGPALRKWENFRVAVQRHDNWWANFIRTARVRMQTLHNAYPSAQFTWLVYRPAYVTRTSEDRQPLIENIQSVEKAYPFIHLVWFDSTSDLIRYINSGNGRSSRKIKGFEYFGHSNKFCFMFDYSNTILGASKTWLHEKELGRINSSAFSPDAYCKSWGCHTAESMSAAWKRATGTSMIGAFGKTDYSNGEIPMVFPPSHWVQ